MNFELFHFYLYSLHRDSSLKHVPEFIIALGIVTHSDQFSKSMALPWWVEQ